jgi:hypothetical protein
MSHPISNMSVHVVTYSFNYHLNCELLCIFCVSLTDNLTESALGFDVSVPDIFFEQCINSELLVKLKTQPKKKLKVLMSMKFTWSMQC